MRRRKADHPEARVSRLAVGLGLVFCSPMAGAQVRLDTVHVDRATPCETAPDDALRIAALWTEARTALIATTASSREALANRMRVRFVRDVDPRSGAVITESLRAFDARDAGEPIFRSMSGDSLSEIGYWRRIDDRTTLFHGPDANALLSEAFVRDHCFRVIGETREHPGWLGLSFQPVRARMRAYSPPDIQGAVWFDATTLELRRLSFVWTTLPGQAPNGGLGGEIQFARIERDPWYVARWHLRMPRDIVEIRGSGDHVIRVQRLGIVEEGGVVLADSLEDVGHATISGVITDANRRPLADATVRVLGTESSARSDSTGRYRLEAVPAGLRVVVADHPTLVPFGVRAGETRVLLDSGAVRTVSFRAPNASALVEALCGRDARAANQAALRLTIVDSVSAQPIAGLLLRLAASERDGRAESVAFTGETDASGAVVFCDVPAGPRLSITTAPDGAPIAELTVRRGEALARTVRAARR